MTLDQIQARLKNSKLKDVESHTGIGENALYRIRGAMGRPPSKATLAKLADFYIRLEAGNIKL